MLRLIVRTVSVCCLVAAAQAAPHRLHVYPNSNLTIFSIAEGPEGFLWLATSDGLYRFDGFHYHKITALPLASTRFAGFTRDGSLWTSGIDGLARLSREQVTVLYKGEVHAMAVTPDHVFARLPDQFISFDLHGGRTVLPHFPSRDLNLDPASGKLWFVCGREARGCSIDPVNPQDAHPFDIQARYQSILPDSTGRLFAADDERAVLLDHSRSVWTLRRRPTLEARRPGPLLAGRNGQNWFLGETVQGLGAKVDFVDRADHARYSPISGYEDHRGRLWVARMGQGLVEWIQDPDWRRWFPEDLDNEFSVLVMRAPHTSPVLATRKNLYRINSLIGKWAPLSERQHRYESLLPLAEGGFLASIRELGVVRLSSGGEIIERLDGPPVHLEQFREIVRDGKGRIWTGSKRSLFRIEGQAGSLRLREQKLPGLQEGENAQAVDLEVDGFGRLWVGYAAGIAWLDEQDRWRKIDTDQPVTMIRSFALAGEDIWVAYRTPGSFSRLHRNGELWNVTPMAAADGYTPVDTHFLKRDSRGWIWRGSPEGVHISDGRHVAPNDWIHLHLRNGLAADQTDQFGFFEDTDGSVWISGAEGVTHLRPQASWFDAPAVAPPPQVTRLEADGHVFLFPASMPSTLPASTKVMRINVGTLHASPFRDHPLRYRLPQLTKDWSLSHNGSIEFRNLPDNDYTLELGYTGNGPSAVGTYLFRIGTSPPRLSWGWPVGILMAAGAIVPIIIYVPWFDRPRFRIEKAVFLLRRKYGGRHLESFGTADDYSGTTFLSRYRLTRIISKGGFSVVYEARDLRDLKTRVAVKVLNQWSGKENRVRERFMHEVAALRSVQHPGIVSVLDSWIAPNGEPCLAMPFLDGETLRAALAHSPFTSARVARIVRLIGAALDEAHSRGIIHRDLKPENLILVHAGSDLEQPVIIDFGTAGLRSAESELAATTLMAGSFHYMAPERLTGRYSPASDIFSLAVIVLEMLTGKRLADLNTTFSDASFQTELEQVIRGKFHNGDLKTLVSSLSRAFDPEPQHRPQHAETWANQVATALDQT